MECMDFVASVSGFVAYNLLIKNIRYVWGDDVVKAKTQTER
jgi:hypothetical protein